MGSGGNSDFRDQDESLTTEGTDTRTMWILRLQSSFPTLGNDDPKRKHLIYVAIAILVVLVLLAKYLPR